MQQRTWRRPGLDVAAIFRGAAASFLKEHGARLSSAQRRVFAELQTCRTAALGGHVRACTSCDHREIAYNSCRNRHCPKCQALARARWLKQREADLLPIPYFHVVFTLPAELAAVALQNRRLLYGNLFQAASETLLELAADPSHLGAKIGILAVLHTWGQNLMHHPHLHCVVSGGGLAPDESQWVASRDYYLLPVRLLSSVFRAKYCQLLERAFDRGELKLGGQLASLADASEFNKFVAAAKKRKWVVYAKRPFREPACVLRYLARYTNRVAISNQRLVRYDDGLVTFNFKDNTQGGQQRSMTLAASEFIRRFLLHTLPSGFMRIRHYGFLANRHRRTKLALCRQLLQRASTAEAESTPVQRAFPLQDQASIPAALEEPLVLLCPACADGRLQTIEIIGRPSPINSSVRLSKRLRNHSSSPRPPPAMTCQNSL